MDLRLKTDCVLQVVGPSGSGKTFFVCKLLSTPEVFQNKLNQIYWMVGSEDGESGQTKTVMKMIKNVTFIKGFQENYQDMIKHGDALVIDDLFHESTKEKDFINLFTKIARHRKVLVIFITQNLFHQGGNHRTRNLNVHYLVIFRNPRDKTVIDFLGRQVFPQDRGFLSQVFEDVTAGSPHSYIFLDFTQECDDEIRVRGDILNPKGIVVYKQNKNE